MAVRRPFKPPVPLTPDQLAVKNSEETLERELIFGMARSMDFYRAARDMVNPYDPVKKTYRKDFSIGRYNMLYAAIDSWWRRFDNVKVNGDRGLNPEKLSAYLIDWSNRSRMLPEECAKLVEEIKEEAALMTEITYESSMALIQSDGFKYWNEQRAIAHAAASMQNQFAAGGMTIESIANIAASAIEMTSNQNADNITDGEEIILGSYAYSPAIPISIGKVDDAIGGGIRKGEATLVAAINGGGKTIFACQAALEIAKLCHNVAIFTTERRPYELMLRMVAMSLSLEFGSLINRPDVQKAMSAAGGTFELLPDWLWKDPNYAESMTNLMGIAKERIRFVDWSRGKGLTIKKDFDGQVRQMANKGWEPDVIVFDWLGGGLDPNMQINELRGHYMQGMEHVVSHGKNFNRAMIITAQLNKERVTPKTKYVSMDMLSECKAISNNVSNFIGISSLRNKGEDDQKFRLERRQFITVDKATVGPGGMFPVEQWFEFQRFQSSNKDNI